MLVYGNGKAVPAIGRSTVRLPLIGTHSRPGIDEGCSGGGDDVLGGGRWISVTCSASHGFGFGKAPPFYYDLRIEESKEGVAQVIVQDRSGFPSLEVWQYSDSKVPGVTNAALLYFYDQGIHTPWSLLKQYVPPLAPPVAPWQRPMDQSP